MDFGFSWQILVQILSKNVFKSISQKIWSLVKRRVDVNEFSRTSLLHVNSKLIENIEDVVTYHEIYSAEENKRLI